MIEDMLTKCEHKLRKGRMGWGESAESEARGVSRGEALEIIKSWKGTGAIPFDKADELRARTQTLRDDPTSGISPFNSSFYVVDLDLATRRVVHVEIRGRGKIREVLLAFVGHILREVYGAQLLNDPVDKYRGVVMSENEQIGDAFYVGRRLNLLVIRLGRKHERITVKFERSRVWTIGVEIFCSLRIRHKIVPLLERLYQEYERLRSTKPLDSEAAGRCCCDGGR